MLSSHFTYPLSSAGDQTQAVSLEDVSQLTDKNGRVWSGAILDSDQVQKPMPGGRVMSYRALVVVGNLRGAAGYGMGKAKTPADAVVSAFRLLRNSHWIVQDHCYVSAYHFSKHLLIS